MEEAGLLGQLGINWKLFLSQAVNFFILLIVLRAFVYKPLLAIIKKRSEKIEEGLRKAQEADIRLKEVDVIGKQKIKSAESEAMTIIKNTEDKAKNMDIQLQKKMEEKQAELSKQIEKNRELGMQEAQKSVMKEATELIKKLLVKTVELKPEDIDRALIKKALLQMQKNGKI